MQEPPPLICLMGPTGAGKTACALALAREFPIEVVSVDSAQVYRGLDIGTAKPDPAERRRLPHHLVDVCDPAEAYSAARFAEAARLAVADIRARGRTPLLVGGTGLYLRALLEGLSSLPAADPVVRAALQAELARDGAPALHARLCTIDPRSAGRIHPHDPQRILRALEVHAQCGIPLSVLQDGVRNPPPDWTPVIWVIAPSVRATLHARLARRFEDMLARGFVNEVAGLRARSDLTQDKPALRAVGYRAAWRHLAGELAHDAMVETAVTATRQLAKRQLTWFRAVPGAEWWDSEDPQLVSRLCIAFAQYVTPRAGHAQVPPQLP